MTTSSAPLPQVTPADRADIESLLADYAWALDTGDLDAFAGCFTADAVVEDPGRTYSGRAELEEFLLSLRDHNVAFRGRQHWIGSLLISPGADGFTARSYCRVTAVLPTGATTIHLLAYYMDQITREDGRTLFRRRVIGPWGGPMLSRFPTYEPGDPATVAPPGA